MTDQHSTPRFVVGHDTETFLADVAEAYGPETAADVARVINRHDTLEQAAEIVNDVDAAEEFETLDAEQEFEQAAQDLAQRVRAKEDLQRRAYEILEQKDEEREDD